MSNGYNFYFYFETECRHASAKAHEVVDHLTSFLSSREEISQLGIEPPIPSLRTRLWAWIRSISGKKNFGIMCAVNLSLSSWASEQVTSHFSFLDSHSRSPCVLLFSPLSSSSWFLMSPLLSHNIAFKVTQLMPPPTSKVASLDCAHLFAQLIAVILLPPFRIN